MKSQSRQLRTDVSDKTPKQRVGRGINPSVRVQNGRAGSPSYSFVVNVSYWEIAIKIQLGKFSLEQSFDDFFGTIFNLYGFTLLPIEVAHAKVLTSLPLHHRDPFDRMLIAQSIAESIPLISCDSKFDAYGIDRIW